MNKNDPIERWDQFINIIKKLSPSNEERWVFRGHQDGKQLLTTSLDYAVNRFESLGLNRKEAENFLLREFKRHFHRYSQYIPSEDNKLEWLSLMQHHGAPTRLLDWTYSAYIALYFAIARANVNSECEVWAINQTYCWKIFKEKLNDCNEQLKKLLDANDKSEEVIKFVLNDFPSNIKIVCPLNPFYLNERLTIQQGTFLIPLGGDLSFEDNFKTSIGENSRYYKKIRIKCTERFLKQAFAELHRINVSAVNLFPGIDGLARSLHITMLLKHLYPNK